MEHLFDLQTLITTYGYIGIFIIVFLESGIFFALPGDSLLFMAGVLASGGLLDIYYLIALIFVATFFGGVVGYYFGVYIERLRKFKFFREILKQEYIDKTRTYLEKKGKFAIVVARFIPIVRTFMPIVAGIANMNLSLYLRYNLLSSLLWSFGVTLVGYFLGNLIPNLEGYLHWLIFAIIGVSLLPVVFSLIKKNKPGLRQATQSADPV